MLEREPPWMSPAVGSADAAGGRNERPGQTMGNCGIAKLWELRHCHDAMLARLLENCVNRLKGRDTKPGAYGVGWHYGSPAAGYFASEQYHAKKGNYYEKLEKFEQAWICALHGPGPVSEPDECHCFCSRQ